MAIGRLLRFIAAALAAAWMTLAWSAAALADPPHIDMPASPERVWRAIQAAADTARK